MKNLMEQQMEDAMRTVVLGEFCLGFVRVHSDKWSLGLDFTAL